MAERRLAAGAVLSLIAAALPAFGADLLAQHLAGIRAELDPRASVALQSIDGTGPRLLAARAYLRNAAHLADRWSWTSEEAAAFERSPAKASLDAAVGRVRCEFEGANPGHTLFVNPSLRTLEIQVEHWNRNTSVARAAAHLREVLGADVRAAGFPAPAQPGASAAFRQRLMGHKPEPTPTIAAPGLSLHGRMNAVDFQVWARGRIVAGPDTRSIPAAWDAGGWAARLQQAVAAADAGFAGPLEKPYEPWHYDYRPRVDGGVLVAACAK